MPNRYDSKSLKLAPEISYTAPVVPAQAVLKAREREEGAAEAEGEEVLMGELMNLPND